MVMVEKTDMTGEMDKINKKKVPVKYVSFFIASYAGSRWISHAGRV